LLYIFVLKIFLYYLQHQIYTYWRVRRRAQYALKFGMVIALNAKKVLELLCNYMALNCVILPYKMSGTRWECYCYEVDQLKAGVYSQNLQKFTTDKNSAKILTQESFKKKRAFAKHCKKKLCI